MRGKQKHTNVWFVSIVTLLNANHAQLHYFVSKISNRFLSSKNQECSKHHKKQLYVKETQRQHENWTKNIHFTTHANFQEQFKRRTENKFQNKKGKNSSEVGKEPSSGMMPITSGKIRNDNTTKLYEMLNTVNIENEWFHSSRTLFSPCIRRATLEPMSNIRTKKRISSSWIKEKT